MSAPDLRGFLSELPDLAARSQLGMSAADFTLDRMQRLMLALDAPQQKYPSIHVAGTNGKGSVCALCAAALQAEGYKVGAFTSPHVEGALLGIRVNSKPVDDAELQAAFAKLWPHLQAEEGWTHFEVVTALMYLHFARTKVDIAVVEVGLGGRLDATNVVTPMVSVITPIDFDHMAILGDTLPKIAGEKAGIIKPGVPVVIAPQAPEALAVLTARAVEQGAPGVEVGKDLLFERGPRDLRGQLLYVSRPSGAAITLRISLLGEYQIENAATAYAALQVANEHGVNVSLEAIRASFEAANWPGRFELLQNEPPLVLDAAHSPGAAMALRRSLDVHFPNHAIILILGISADKDLEGLLAPLLPRLSRAIATQALHPRAMDAGQLAQRLSALGLDTSAQPDPGAAARAGLTSAGEGTLVLVAGSVFLVESVRQALVG